MRRVVLPALLALLASACSAVTGPDVTSADIAHHVHALADDALEGRATGSAGSLAAADYLAGVLRDAGLRGAGDAGGFLQRTDTQRFTSDGPPVLQFFGSAGNAAAAGASESSAPVTAVFGVEFSYRSGAPLDATLPLVVVRAAADVPRTPRADAALCLGVGGRQARSWLAAADTPEGRGWGLLLLAGDAQPGTRDDQPATGLLTTPAGRLPPPATFTVRGPLRDRLLGGEFARVHVALRAGTLVPAVNVLGVLDGVGTQEEPALARQAIVLTAHYDHLGVARSAEEAARPHGAPAPPPAAPGAGPAPAPAADTPPEPAPAPDASPAAPDLIYNGADDDASGCAALLELAQAFGAEARAGRRPARTLVFLLVTGEEVGLLGTEYYLDHPVVPLADTVCNLNFEMLGRADPLAGGAGRLWLTGFERSNLGPAWAAAGLPVTADPRPEQHFFERSDNYAFVQRGIVGQTLSSYNLHEDYHTVRDEPDTLDYAHLEVAIRASLAAARSLADGSLLPAWNPAPESVPAATPRTLPEATEAPGR